MKTHSAIYAAVAWLMLSPALGIAADGADIFANFCQGCHGENAEGLRQFNGSAEEFQGILEGERDNNMPDFYGVFGPEEVAALYQFITGSEPS
jgi:mono/diheme cytochrome c family protein